ncbi:polysaccharide deacetylase family protein [Gracilibacillus sp. S3-1-1]|uniref:Polysaccharide deacetylase family protein n=1 Tax=Gracilibacillus pellucidus TaxID=3095368 RepID=A0ACC6M771_9BACI|nr:polysaccharide deacetylase family protein [Gracilibacillus sp. S3-1-1]MDX8046830.1 polysaccharide deacetylase family protein [Gracilibacillus sp. S3-1-1]
MKPTRLTQIILVIIGLVGLAILAYFYWQGDDKEDTGNDTKEKHETVEHSQYSGVDIITDTLEEETFYKAIHYPKFKEQSLNDAIGKYVSEIEQSFQEELDKQDIESLQEHPAQLYVTFDIYPVTDEVYSIVFEEEGYFGGANPRLHNKVFIVDLETNRLIKQTEIIQNTKENKEELHNLLFNGFKDSEQYSPFLNEDYLKAWIQQENNEFSNMYLTNQSVVFAFDKYEVTAGAAGMPEIELPFEQVREILSDEWLERLNEQDKTDSDESTEPNSEKNEEKSKEEPKNDVSENKKRVALTFDDGPHPTNTTKILELLKEYDAKATFFMLGNRVDFYPTIAKEVAENGHEIGNHTWSHKDLTTLDSETIKQEIDDTSEIIFEATGQKPTVLRPPYGATNKQVEAATDLPLTLWTIDTLDWKSHDPEAILKEVKENVQDGSIILMHDIHETTVEAVEPVLTYLAENDYEFVTVSELS